MLTVAVLFAVMLYNPPTYVALAALFAVWFIAMRQQKSRNTSSTGS